MRPGDASDPLLRQVLPTAAENDAGQQASGLIDPVGDLNASPKDGLIQKYRGRLLVIASGTCAVNCRYCFRRHFPYDLAPKGHAALQQALEALRQDQSLSEVILSGGDPLMLADSSLSDFSMQLDAIPHVNRLRIHSRLPVVIPTRICDSLLDWTSRCSKAIYFVLHFNHANEIDQHVVSALKQLRAAGATVLNQAVLLRGVNDSFAAQRDLCEKLVDNNVLPYYLHQLDTVRGAMHFETDQDAGRAIVAKLREHLPGFAVPTFVREIPGQPSKTPL
jgi:EF-P beta-lysylation protein EpmB